MTIFGSESDSAAQEEGRVVKETQPAVEAKPAVAAQAAPKVEPAKATPAAEEAALFQCPNCNGAVKESDNVCPHCGAMFVEEEVSQFECPACGTLVNADATTCPGCGAIFVEEGEGAEEAAPAEAPKAAPAAAPTPAPTTAAAPAATPAAEVEGEEAVTVSETSSEATAQDEEIRRKVLEIKEGRGQEAEVVKKVRKPGLGGLFKGGKKEEEAAATGVPQKVIAVPKPGPAAATPAMTIAPPPMTKRQFPTDPKAQGAELAKMVNDVRSLLNIATERRLVIDESKDMLDRAIAAGRERQLQNALTLLSTAEDRLNVRLREYAVATFSSLQDEIAVAKKLGGNTAKPEVLAKEAKRAAETPDYQAAFVFIDKAKTELSPITGRYNSVRDILRKYERLVKDSRAVGIDNEPLKETLEEAKAAFEGLDFEKAESIAHGSIEEIMGQVKTRIGPEIDKAKSMLVEVKMKAEAGGVGPQITILKSAIKAYKEENYLEAMAEIKRFKKEMKKLITPA